MSDVAITDLPEEARYVLDVDGRRAGFVTYRLGDGQIALLHAEVDPPMRSHGLASRLIEFTLDDARARGLRCFPTARSCATSSSSTTSTSSSSRATLRPDSASERRAQSAAPAPTAAGSQSAAARGAPAS